MPIFPVRNLSKYGVISDADPFNLPPEAFSVGVNVRFRNGSILRAPVFRTANNSLFNANPRYLTANLPIGGFDSVITGYLNGRVTQFTVGAGESDISIAAYVNADSSLPYTSTHLANVFYINRGDRTPWALRVTDAALVNIDSVCDWPANYTAKLFRACGSAGIAFGVNKAGTDFPTMVKTSEFATNNTIPNWDPTVAGTNATENILADMEGSITDAQNLGEQMVIYGLNETWMMTADGSTNVWSYHRLFNDAGSINANCSIEVDRKHFVFGLTDLYVHDGATKKSICDQRTREFVFGAANISKSAQFFVAHNQQLKEIYFCFNSGDGYTGFLASKHEGCNRAAVFNYADDNWTYYDLPYVRSAWRVNLDQLQTYATATTSYAATGGTYLDQDDSIKKVFTFIGETEAFYNLTGSLYAFDLQGPGSVMSLPVDLNATLGWTIIREGIDLDEVGAKLSGYKIINSIYPQARLEAMAEPLNFYVGAVDYANDNITWAPVQTFDASTNYKLDYNMPGRYLAIKITHDDYHWVNFTGFDIDLDVNGER